MARRAAIFAATGKRVRVVHSFTVPQGIAAMFEYLNHDGAQVGASLDALVDAMTYALPHVVTCEVTHAIRDAEFDSVKVCVGQFIGLINDNLVTAGDEISSTTASTLRKANADRCERITLYYGRDISQRQAEQLVATLKAEFSHQEFEIYDGGQPLYPYVISVE